MNTLQSTIEKITPINEAFIQKAQQRLDSLTKPQGSLGRLESVAKQIVGITENEHPSLKNKVIFTFAGDHGVTAEGVSAFPSDVTVQMVYNFLAGGAAINVLARQVGARVVVADLGVAVDLNPHPDLVIKKVNYGTHNMAKAPAMSHHEAVQSIENGIKIFETAFENGIDIAATGDMGIGNTTASSAITAVLTGAQVDAVAGRGTGLDEKALWHKCRIIQQAITVNHPDQADALDVLAKVGGFEIGGLAGVILAAAAHRVPVVIDGFISGAAALIAYHLAPLSKDYMIAGHCSEEKGHKILLEHLKLIPLLDLNLRLGEGTGAALAIPFLEASIKILTEMATFHSAGVSEKK